MNVKKYLFLLLLTYGFSSVNAQNAQIAPLEKKDLFKKEAITFYM